MDPPRLAALAIDVAIHPIVAGSLFAALGLNVARLDDSAELRLDDGVVVRLTQTTTPSRVGLTFAVRDLGEAAKALDGIGIEWTVTGPDVIRAERVLIGALVIGQLGTTSGDRLRGNRPSGVRPAAFPQPAPSLTGSTRSPASFSDLLRELHFSSLIADL